MGVSHFGREALICRVANEPPTAEVEVIVLFTDVASTVGALRTASQLGQGLHVRIRLVAPQCVPYPLPVDRPPIDVAVLRQQVKALAETAGVGPVAADIVLCRDQPDAVRAGIHPRSVIVIGKRGGWWPKPEDRLAKRLRAAGHHVVRTSGLEKGRTGWTRFMSVLGFFSLRSVGRW